MLASFDFRLKYKDKPRPALANTFFFPNRVDEPQPLGREDSGFSSKSEGWPGIFDDTKMRNVVS